MACWALSWAGEGGSRAAMACRAASSSVGGIGCGWCGWVWRACRRPTGSLGRSLAALREACVLACMACRRCYWIGRGDRQRGPGWLSCRPVGLPWLVPAHPKARVRAWVRPLRGEQSAIPPGAARPLCVLCPLGPTCFWAPVLPHVRLQLKSRAAAARRRGRALLVGRRQIRVV